MELEKMECAGTSRSDVMSDLESGLNVGLYKLEQAVFMLDDLSHLFKPDDGEIDISVEKTVRLKMAVNRARVLISIACDSAHEAFSSLQDADEACGNLFELDRSRIV